MNLIPDRRQSVEYSARFFHFHFFFKFIIIIYACANFPEKDNNADWRPENPEEMLMSVCSSLIAIVDRGGHQVVQFSHFSVKEYLTSERLATAAGHLSYFHILPEPAHTLLARASITVLLQLDDEIDGDTIAHFPLSLYAA